MEEEKKKGFLTACKDYFGFLPGQNLKGFADEMRALSNEFKAEIFAYFQKAGLVCDPPQAAKAIE